MVRRYKRLLIAILLVLLAAATCWPSLVQQGKNWVHRYKTGSLQEISDSVHSSLVYPVKPDHWVTFALPKATPQLRFIVNAHIKPPSVPDVQENWPFILHYQLLNEDRQVLADDLYHLNSHLTAYKDEHENFFYGNFYTGYDLVPLDGRLVKLSTEAVKQAAYVRISFVRQRQDVEEVAIRLYIPAKIPRHKLSSLWLRMDKKQQEIVARNNVYPAMLLTEYERNNLLTNQWQPIGPSGVEGKDYIPLTLYILKEIEQEKLGESMLGIGVQVDSRHPGVIPIPEQGGELTLRFNALDGRELTKNVEVKLNWFGRTKEQRWQRMISVAPGEKQIFPLKGGLLQLTSDSDFLVNAGLKNRAGQEQDITPAPLTILTYAAEKQVEYNVLHVNHQPTAMRVDIRQVLYPNETSANEDIEYQWFDRQHHLIDQGVLPIHSQVSHYDRLTREFKDLNISDPVSFYFNIPSDVSFFKLSARKKGLVVNAYNQPFRFEKKQRVPENSFISLDKSDWYPAWFLLKPNNEQLLVKQHGLVKVAGQYRPPEDSPALAADLYLWEDYRPEQPTLAHYVLSEMPVSDYRDQALAQVYCQLALNRNNLIDFKAYGVMSNFSPELIYDRKLNSAFDVAIYLDGKKVLQRPLIGQQGAVKLPLLKRGRHQIKISTSGGGRWMMNYVGKCPSKTYLKRRVFKFNQGRLSFLYHNKKAIDRVFSGRFYSAAGNKQRADIQISIEALHKQVVQMPRKAWTFTQRRFDIRPPAGSNSIVLNSHGHYLNAGESFFIPFNSDMPKGLYRIKIRLNNRIPAYLALSQLQPGLFEQRRFYRETND